MTSQEVIAIVKSILNSSESIVFIDEIVEDYLTKHRRGNSLLISEETVRLVPQVSSRLKGQIRKDVADGITPGFNFDEHDPNKLRRCDLGVDSGAVEPRLVRYRKAVMDTLNEIDWRQFEHLCKFLLKSSGFVKCQVGRGTKDGGVDFWGLLDVNELTGESNLILRGMVMRVVGQAKHKLPGNEVSEDEMSVITTKISNVRNRQGKGWENAPDWFKESNSVIVGIYMTNVRYSTGADEEADRQGIIRKNGGQLVEAIIRSGQWSEWISRTGQKETFDKAKFIKIIMN